MVGQAKNFRRSEDGATLLEGLIVFPIILLTFATFIEFGVAMVQWNQTAKAAQIGARVLAVSDPLVSMTPFESYGNLIAGDPVPDEMVVETCGPNEANCVGTGFARVVARMSAVNPRIGPENVRVTYYRTGLGYVGRPDGAVVTIRVEVVNLTFGFFFLGRLLGLNNFTVPTNPVTITSEDLAG